MVKVRDTTGREVQTRCLQEGDHFGEISLLYKCNRSATVTSGNYNTLARLVSPAFKELISEFPEYEAMLRDHVITEYGDKKDPKIEFMKRTINRVPYF